MISLAISVACRGQQCAPTWSTTGWGIHGDVFSACVHDEFAPGTGRSLFVGGGVTLLPGFTTFNRVGRWDGWAWAPLGPVPYAQEEWVESTHAVPSEGSVPGGLYVGGHFNSMGQGPLNNLGRWARPNWDDPGGGVSFALPWWGDMVLVSGVFDPDGPGPAPAELYVGGQFEQAGPIPADCLAKWDGVTWSIPGTGLTRVNPSLLPIVAAMLVFDDDGSGPRHPALYFGGRFAGAPSILSSSVIRWDGASFEGLSWGCSGRVHSLGVFDKDGPGSGREELYVGGSFLYAGNAPVWLPVVGLARWDGALWHTVGGWQHGTVLDMAVFDDDGPGPRLPALFVGGYFDTVPGNVPARRIARWDGVSWTALGTGLNGNSPNCAALAVFDEDGPGPNPGGLYAGGWFQSAGGLLTNSIARWGCPLPPRCDANCTKDFHPVTGQHILTVADFGCFQTRYVLQDPYADCNEDGALTVADFGCFQTKFATGCP